MFFLLYLFNHMMITLIRAFVRTQKLKYVPFQNNPDFTSFQKGFERRILRASTFIYAFGLSLTEYFLAAELFA
ncbi:MAG: hypothetical protein RIE58_04725 [Vicingaceae bacterium]